MCSYIFTYFVTVPHSILTQLAWPLNNAKQGKISSTALVSAQEPEYLQAHDRAHKTHSQHILFALNRLSIGFWMLSSNRLCAAGNVFGVVPNNAARDVSIILMVIHEVRPCP